MITQEIILEKCVSKKEVKRYFNNEVFWLDLDKLEDLYALILKINVNSIPDPTQKVNLLYLEIATRLLLDDIYEFKRSRENNWERFRKYS